MDGVKIMTFCMSVAWVWSDSKWATPSSFHSTGIMAGLVLKLQSNHFFYRWQMMMRRRRMTTTMKAIIMKPQQR